MRFILYVGLAFMLIGCNNNPGNDSFKDYRLDEHSFDQKTLEMIERRIGITFPDDVHGMNMFYRGSQIDPSFVAKIEIPAFSQNVLSQQIEQIHDREGIVTGSLAEKESWWTPSKSTIQMERQYLYDMNYVRVLLCKENNEKWILYIEWIKI